jgi:hypothetical protein
VGSNSAIAVSAPTLAEQRTNETAILVESDGGFVDGVGDDASHFCDL